MLIEHLPPDAALVRVAGKSPAGWGVAEYLLTDVFHALTGNPHPSRPKPPKDASRHVSLAQRLKAQAVRTAAERT